MDDNPRKNEAHQQWEIHALPSHQKKYCGQRWSIGQSQFIGHSTVPKQNLFGSSRLKTIIGK